MGTFVFVSNVFAQSADVFGLKPVGDSIALGGQDIRITIAKIIRVILGLLGIIAMGIVLYGGFVYMTSGGNEEKVAQAKKIIINGIIGLAIILSAFSIASFIINSLAGATINKNPPNDNLSCLDSTYREEHPAKCDKCIKWPQTCCEEYFIVKSITPVTNATNMNNVVIRVLFSKKLSSDYTSNTKLREVVQVFGSSGTNITNKFDFVLKDGLLVELTPNNNSGLKCEGTTNCLADGNYTIKVNENTKSINNEPLTTDVEFCGEYPLEGKFITNHETKGFYFDGVNDYIEVTSTDMNITTGDFTVAVWAKSVKFIQRSSIINKGAYFPEKNIGYNIGFISNPKNVWFVVSDGPASSPANTLSRTYDTSTSSRSGVFDWAHFVLVKTGNQIKAYTNGVLVGTAGGVDSSISNVSNFLIGKSIVSNKFFNGYIDDVYFYRRALNDTEITSLFQKNASIPRDTALVGEWKFDNVVGNKVIDSSGRNNNAVVYGATWVEGTSGGTSAQTTYNLGFDGIDDYIEVSDNSVLDLTDAISVSTWVKSRAEGYIVAKDPYVWQTVANNYIPFMGPWNWVQNEMQGTRFTPKKDGTVDKLCKYSKGNQTLKLWDSSFNELASVQSLNTVDEWKCETITSPVLVQANKLYYVGICCNDGINCIRRAESGNVVYPLLVGDVEMGRSFSVSNNSGCALSGLPGTSANAFFVDINFVPSGSTPVAEICNDNLDNDGDGKLDCSDPDCVGNSACQTTKTNVPFALSTIGKGQFLIKKDGVDHVVNSSVNINDNLWHHVVATYSKSGSGEMKIYVDGNLTGTATGYTGGMPTNNDPLFIGRSYDPAQTTNYFKGNIQDLKIYNRALSLSEVGQLFNKQTVPTGLISSWDFNLGSGTSLSDNERRNIGTFKGGVQWSSVTIPASGPSSNVGVKDSQSPEVSSLAVDNLITTSTYRLRGGKDYDLTTQIADESGFGYLHIEVEKTKDHEGKIVSPAQKMMATDYYYGPSVAQGSNAPFSAPYQFSHPLNFKNSSTTIYTAGLYTVRVTVYDIDNNRTIKTLIVSLIPESCTNGQLDPGEVTSDEGGVCGRGEGESCDTDNDCSYSLRCIDHLGDGNKVCTAYPMIEGVSPMMSGAGGNWITVYGKHFGEESGNIQFAVGNHPTTSTGSWANANLADCEQDVWHDKWVIVQVPEDNTTLPLYSTSTIKLQTTSTIQVGGVYIKPYDTTVDDWGLDSGQPGLFTKNTEVYPGLCSVGIINPIIDPETELVVVEAGENRGLPGDEIEAIGQNLGDDRNGGKLLFGGDNVNTQVSDWNDTNILSVVPELTAEWYGVYAQMGSTGGSKKSNAVPFHVLDEGFLRAPIIESIDPPTTTPGSYITIYGKRFGKQVGQYKGRVFLSVSKTEAKNCLDGTPEVDKCLELSDAGFPQECSETWFNDHVIVGIPKIIPQIFRDNYQNTLLTQGEVATDLLSSAGLGSEHIVNSYHNYVKINDSETFLLMGRSLEVDVVLDDLATSTGQFSKNSTQWKKNRYVLIKSPTSTDTYADFKMRIEHTVDVADGAVKRTLYVESDTVRVYSMIQPNYSVSFPLQNDVKRFKFKIKPGYDGADKKLFSYLSTSTDPNVEPGTPSLANTSDRLFTALVSSTKPLFLGYNTVIGSNNVYTLFGIIKSLKINNDALVDDPNAYFRPYIILESSAEEPLNTSGNDQYTIINGDPAPGICLISPASGPAPLPVGEFLTLYGNNFPLDPFVYFRGPNSDPNNVSSTGGWLEAEDVSLIPLAGGGQMITTTIPYSETILLGEGPHTVKVKKNTTPIAVSNGLDYLVIDCTKASKEESTRMESRYQCCTAGKDLGKWKLDSSVCDGQVREAGYVWRFTTGIIKLPPYVVEQCDQEHWNDPGVTLKFPSPVPWIGWKSGDSVCLNASVAVYFSRSMDENTINSSTVKMYKCTATEDNTTGCTTAIPLEDDEIILSSQVLYIRQNPPSSDLTSSTWYQVKLSKDITSYEEQQQVGTTTIIRELLKPTEPCDNGDYAYCYYFKTGTGQCNLEGVYINPLYHRARLLGIVQSPFFPYIMTLEGINNPPHPYYYLLWGKANQPCTIINVDGLGWVWDSIDDTKAVSINAPKSGQYTDSRAKIRALQNTAPGTVDITAEATTTVTIDIDGQTVTSTEHFLASTTLKVDLYDPQVIEWWPDCINSCANGTVGVRFNMPMVTNTYPGGLILEKCSDEFCDTIVNSIPVTTTIASIEIYEVAPINNLLPNTWYRVTVTGTIFSIGRIDASGNVLANGDPLIPHVWRFRTKMVDEICILDKASLYPDPFVAHFIDEKTIYNVMPISAPNQCNPNGQKLNPWNYGWQWDVVATSTLTSNYDVATSTHFEEAGTFKPYCDFACLLAGSNYRDDVRQPFICGNGVIEPGEDCDIATTTTSTDSNPAQVHEIAGQSCNLSCLRPGNPDIGTGTNQCGNGTTEYIYGEECDTAKPSEINYCKPNCTWEGSSQLVQNRSNLVSQCGSGSVTKGEDCDLGITSTTIPEGKIGCSDKCLHTGTILSQMWCDVSTNTMQVGTTTRSINEIGECNHAASICGNSVLESGEECEFVYNSNVWQQERIKIFGEAGDFQIVTSTVVTSTKNICSNKCLLENICGQNYIDLNTAFTTSSFRCAYPGEGCRNDCHIRGASVAYTLPSMCGDTVDGVGEYPMCELRTSTALGQKPLQIVTAIGEGAVDPETNSQNARIKATAINYKNSDGSVETLIIPVDGFGTYGLYCGYTEYTTADANGNYNDCPGDSVMVGAGSDMCCRPRLYRQEAYPADGTGLLGASEEGVCRNTYIEAKFRGEIDPDTIENNAYIVSGHASGHTCLSTEILFSNQITSTLLAYEPGEQIPGGFWSKLWYHIKTFFVRLFAGNVYASLFTVSDPVWCASPLKYQTNYEYNQVGDAKASTTTISFYINNLLEPETNYVVFLRGGAEGIKDTNGVGIRGADDIDSGAGTLYQLKDSWLFKTNTEICTIDNLLVLPSDYLFQTPNTTSTFHVLALTDTLQKIVPTNEYNWEWVWGPQNNELFSIPAVGYPGDSDYAVLASTNLEGHVYAVVQAEIEDLTRQAPVDGLDPLPVDPDFGTQNHTTAYFNLTSSFCENPWPPVVGGVWTPFEDSDYNFSFNYCADAGLTDNTTDDLPYLDVVEMENKVCNGSNISCNTDADCPGLLYTDQNWNARFYAVPDPDKTGFCGFVVPVSSPDSQIYIGQTGPVACAGDAMCKSNSTLVTWANAKIVSLPAGYNLSVANHLLCAGIANSSPAQCVVDPNKEVLKKYLFVADKNDDAIGLQILRNPDRLSALNWFRDKFKLATTNPQVIELNGYDAITDGENYYVNALNADTANHHVYNNIYQISLNKGMQANTKNVFDQIFNNFKFNANLLDVRMCGYADGSIDLSRNTKCSSDLDCYNAVNVGHCGIGSGDWNGVNFVGSNLNSLSVLSDNELWVSDYNGKLYYTNNGGNTWINEATSTAILSGKYFKKVDFVDSSHGWAVDNNGIVFKKTVDTWQNLGSVTSTSGFEYRDAFFINTNNAWVVAGKSGNAKSRVFKTLDGGSVWQEEPVYYYHSNGVTLLDATTFGPSKIFFTPDSQGWGIGSRMAGSGTDVYGIIFKRDNDQNRWLVVSTTNYLALVNQFNDIYFANDSIGFIVGNNGLVLKTTDAGNNWLDISTSSFSDINLTAVHFYDANKGVMVGNKTGDTKGYVLKTLDGGATWEKYHLPVNTGEMRDAFINSSTSMTVLGANYILNNDTEERICRSDSDCFNGNTCYGYEEKFCVAPKAKLLNDWTRVRDVADIQKGIEAYNFVKGYYPDLKKIHTSPSDPNEAQFSSYLPGYVTSRWSSWGAFGSKVLGLSGIASDPLNIWQNCPANFEQTTCWDETNLSYYCAYPSSVYEYKFVSTSPGYSLNIPFEYLTVVDNGEDGDILGDMLPNTSTIQTNRACTPGQIESLLGDHCGDGMVTPSNNEQCDPVGSLGALVVSSTHNRYSARQKCNLQCQWELGEWAVGDVCGNGDTEGNEACDDGDKNGTYGMCAGPNSRYKTNIVDANGNVIHTINSLVGECQGLHQEYCGDNVLQSQELCEKKDDVLVSYSLNLGTCGKDASRSCSLDDQCFSALSFDGNNDSLSSEQDIPLGNGPFTMEFWFKQSEVLRTDSEPIVAFHRGNSPEDPDNMKAYFALEIGRNKNIGFGQAGFMNRTGKYSYVKTNDNVFYLNNWFHIALMSDGTGKVSIFVNGVELASVSNFVTSDNLAVDKIYIGNPPYFLQYGLTGVVDEFKIHNQVIDPALFRTYYDNTDLISEYLDSAVGWHLDEGMGSDIYNYKNSTFDASISGAKWVTPDIFTDTCGNISKKYTYLRYGDQWRGVAVSATQCSSGSPAVKAICKILRTAIHLGVTSLVNGGDYKDNYCSNSLDNLVLCKQSSDCVVPTTTAYIFTENEFLNSDLTGMMTSFTNATTSLGTCAPFPTGKKYGAPYNFYKDLSCAWNCQNYGSYCGDGMRDAGYGEECDDTNTVNDDGCNIYCKTQGTVPPTTTIVTEPESDLTCGNNIKDKGEECDEGVNNGIECSISYGKGCTYCASDCKKKIVKDPINFCGNGQIDLIGYDKTANEPIYEACDVKNGVVQTSSSGHIVDAYCYNSQMPGKNKFFAGSFSCESSCTKLVDKCFDCGAFNRKLEDNGTAVPRFDIFSVLTPTTTAKITFNNHTDDRKLKFGYFVPGTNVSSNGTSTLNYSHDLDVSSTNPISLGDVNIETNPICNNYSNPTPLATSSYYWFEGDNTYSSAANFALIPNNRLFYYPVNNEADIVKNQYIVAPNPPEGSFRVVVKWSDKYVPDTEVKFQGIVYNSGLDEKQTINYVDANLSTSKDLADITGSANRVCNSNNYEVDCIGKQYDGVYVHGQGDFNGTHVQSFTIDTYARGFDTKNYAFVVDQWGKVKRISGQTDSSPISPYMNSDLTVEVYEHKSDGGNIYHPDHTYTIKNETTADPKAEYWHVFNLEYNSSLDKYEVKEIGGISYDETPIIHAVPAVGQVAVDYTPMTVDNSGSGLYLGPGTFPTSFSDSDLAIVLEYPTDVIQNFWKYQSSLYGLIADDNGLVETNDCNPSGIYDYPDYYTPKVCYNSLNSSNKVVRTIVSGACNYDNGSGNYECERHFIFAKLPTAPNYYRLINRSTFQSFRPNLFLNGNDKIPSAYFDGLKVYVGFNVNGHLRFYKFPLSFLRLNYSGDYSRLNTQSEWYVMKFANLNGDLNLNFVNKFLPNIIYEEDYKNYD